MEYIEAAQRFEENAAGLVLKKCLSRTSSRLTIIKVWASMKFLNKDYLFSPKRKKRHSMRYLILMMSNASIFKFHPLKKKISFRVAHLSALKFTVLLQIGYFKAKHYFFRVNWQEAEEDVKFILEQYFPEENKDLQTINNYQYYTHCRIDRQTFWLSVVGKEI